MTVGANVDTVLEQLGNTNRIDETEYGFEWYVYNADYARFCMVGVEADRVCAVFSNCSDFEFNGINSGDDYAQTADYTDNLNFRFYADTNGHVDSVMYNPRPRGIDDSTSVKRSKAMILLDMINANRSKNAKPIYIEDSDMSVKTLLSGLDFMQDENTDSEMITQSGYDVFSVYRQLLEADNQILVQDTMYQTSVGLNMTTDISGRVHASIISDTERVAPIPETQTVEIEKKDYAVNPVEEVTVPVLVQPVTENRYDEGDDIVIELESQASTQYHIEMFD
ncbi:MAG: hypothetical protein IJX57_04545, partial [Clostridia bacterium]|nr:hypothetical protein [Clostridia bacterium]